MKILAIDTALGACSAALVADGAVLACEYREMARGHAEALAPMVESVMRAGACSFFMLERIGVTTGPGTFTGQRVGLAFARGLGVALKVPVIGATTLDAMAEEALVETRGRFSWAVAAADAKRGEIYLAARNQAGERLAPQLIPLAEVLTRLSPLREKSGNAVAVAGTAAGMLVPLLAAAGFVAHDSLVRQPHAAYVAHLCARVGAGHAPRPLYLRPPDARLPSPS